MGTEGDLVQKARDLAYEYVTDASGLRAASGPRLLGLFANEEMFQQAPEGEAPSTTLRLSAPDDARAVEILSQDPDGFFLMVEEEV